MDYPLFGDYLCLHLSILLYEESQCNSPAIHFIWVNPLRTGLVQVSWRTVRHQRANNWGKVTGLKYCGHVSATLLYTEQDIEIWEVPTSMR